MNIPSVQNGLLVVVVVPIQSVMHYSKEIFD